MNRCPFGDCNRCDKYPSAKDRNMEVIDTYNKFMSEFKKEASGINPMSPDISDDQKRKYISRSPDDKKIW